MYVDAQLVLAGSIVGNTVTPANVFGNGTTIVSGSFSGGNVVDLLQNRDIGEGEDIYARINITTEVTGGTSMAFNAVVADDSALTTNVTIVGSTGPLLSATAATAGAFTVGVKYTIATVGTTDFTLIGALSNTVGAAFTATGVGAGTGTAKPTALQAGARHAVDLRPLIGSVGQRYLGLQVVNVGNNTAGAIFSDLGLEIQDGQKYYPAGFSVI
jgi:hypothetical protein